MLSKEALSFIIKQFGQANIDLFATRANKKVNKYISWKRDSDSIVVDAFSVTWEKCFNHCFPPFNLIWRVLIKIKKESANTILITPL